MDRWTERPLAIVRLAPINKLFVSTVKVWEILKHLPWTDELDDQPGLLLCAIAVWSL